jgi:hypothetical protein
MKRWAVTVFAILALAALAAASMAGFPWPVM